MNTHAMDIVAAILIGVGATVIMDIWAYFQKKVLGMPSLNYCLVGRWLRHMPSGTFKHHRIESSSSKTHECTLGWIAHYAIGVAYAIGLILMVSPGWIQKPSLFPPLFMGLTTVSMPFLIMQPAFGLGIAARKSPKPNRTRFLSLIAHGSYGLGLYLVALMISSLVRF